MQSPSGAQQAPVWSAHSPGVQGTINSSSVNSAGVISLLSNLTVPALGGGFVSDCWGYESPSGREYAIIGLSSATGVVDITDPGDPQILGVIASAGPVELNCDYRECGAQFTSYCLEQRRNSRSWPRS